MSITDTPRATGHSQVVVRHVCRCMQDGIICYCSRVAVGYVYGPVHGVMAMVVSSNGSADIALGAMSHVSC